MQAYGSDRVRRGNGGQWVLLCPRPKAWIGRTAARTAVATEAPGTAVLWTGEYFEVVSATPSGSGVRYVLEPWHDENVMRSVDTYDDASEVRREVEYRAAVAREANRRTASLLGVLTGNLPAAVQERLESELGVVPVRLTLCSLILPFLFVGFVALERASRYINREPPLHPALTFIGLYLLVESVIRLHLALGQSRPAGSAAGYVLYTLFYLLSPKREGLVPPVESASPDRLRLEVPADVRRNDAMTTVEPLLTLLSPAEQRVLAEQLPYDYRNTSRKTAVLILVCAAVGVGTSAAKLGDGGGISPLLSLVVAGGLVIEQIIRLRAFKAGPAGSVLAPLARPLYRRLIASAPPQ